MFIQGNLQTIFDALYDLDQIDPALKANWAPVEKAYQSNPLKFQRAIQVLNSCNENFDSLKRNIKNFDNDIQLFLAMEVARELIEFEDRKTIH